MGRPHKERRVGQLPPFTHYKPAGGISLRDTMFINKTKEMKSMSIDQDLTYELFIKNAFNKGKCSDFAALVKTEEFEPGSLEEMKVAVAHAMTIFINRLINASKIVNENDITAMEICLNNVITAPDKNTVSNLIKQFEAIWNTY
ncbi:MAG: hypothetical protein H6Q68_587 [Firmicutes bacterium]|nr:hypothetical protein [Bacillota bacterium]